MATGKSFNDMVTRVVFELGRRTDLQATAVPQAILDAIEVYQKERFRFNELQPLAPFTFNIVPTVAYYGAAADARIPQLYKIDYLNYILGGEIYKIDRASSPEQVYLANQAGATQTGQPELWGYDGNTLVFYPYPNTTYPVTVGGYLAVAAPTDLQNDTTNPWMNEAERLIRSRAKFDIATHVTRNAEMAKAMSPQGGMCEVYFSELKGEGNKIRGTSRVKAMPF